MKYLVLLFIAAILFSTQVYRPIDGSGGFLWREADEGSIARNFYRDGLNIFYPKIDWRGTGPGYVESGFPLLEWLGAILYRIFGFHEWLLRLISLIAMLGSCSIFFLLARFLMNEKTAFLASILFILHPLTNLLATAIQPESLMLFFYLSAIYMFLKWIKTDQMSYYLLALGATIFAILAKIPALQIGILFTFLSFDKYGTKAIFNSKLWIFAFCSLTPPFLWYAHARSLWLNYGNSLGITNEAYARIGNLSFKYFITNRIMGNLIAEFKKVWIGFGMILGAIGFYSFYKKPGSKLIQYWTITLIIYYIIAGGTTGSDWAGYYHIVSVPLACLVMAEGYSFLVENFSNSPWAIRMAYSLLIIVVGYESAVFAYRTFIKKPIAQDLYLAAQQFKPLIKENALIIANGPANIDEYKTVVSNNASYFFYWLDKKGFTLCSNCESIEQLKNLIDQNASYFIIEEEDIEANPSFYHKVFQTFPVISKTDAATLVELSPKSKQHDN